MDAKEEIRWCWERVTEESAWVQMFSNLNQVATNATKCKFRLRDNIMVWLEITNSLSIQTSVFSNNNINCIIN